MRPIVYILGLSFCAGAFGAGLTCKGESAGLAVVMELLTDDATGLVNSVLLKVGDDFQTSYQDSDVRAETVQLTVEENATVAASRFQAGDAEGNSVSSTHASHQGVTRAQVFVSRNDASLLDGTILLCEPDAPTSIVEKDVP